MRLVHAACVASASCHASRTVPGGIYVSFTRNGCQARAAEISPMLANMGFDYPMAADVFDSFEYNCRGRPLLRNSVARN